MASKAEKIKSYTFTWEGQNKRGDTSKGEIVATSIAMAKAELRRRGFRPLRLKRKTEPFFKPRKQPIKAIDIATFTRQLATMVKSGVPLVQSLNIIATGHEKPAVQEMTLAIKNEVEAGTSLAQALKLYPKQFDTLYRSLVDAGEQSGSPEAMLDRIATYKEKLESIKAQIKKALTYPAITLIVAAGVTSLLLLFVVPQFEDMFSSFGAELPAFTRLVLDMWDVLRAYGLYLLVALVASGLGIKKLYQQNPKVTLVIDQILLKLPVFGQLLGKAAIARFCRTLSTTFAAGVPIVEALDTVSRATGNSVYNKAVANIQREVATGQPLQSSMRTSKVFPNMAIQMIAIGEESGSLEEMLSKVADIYEEDVDNTVANLSSLIEPIIMVVLGVLIGGLVTAMYLPIFAIGGAF